MHKSYLILLILVLMTLPTILPLFNNRFFYTQDYIFIARLQQMGTALSSGQFPVRWAPDLRYGEPIFNFYTPLPYYVGALIHLLGFNFIWVAKILFMLSAILSAVTMYALANKLFGFKAGILSAVLYTYAPYRAVDLYVRGSLSETWAFIFFPLIFYCSLLLAEKRTLKNLSFLGLSLAGLFLTHNVSTLMFLPFITLWWIYLIIITKKWQVTIHFILASILGVGLAASFLLPAIFERDLIQTQYLVVGYFNFRAHFVAFKQFFSLFWGYGSSVWGPNDGLSFQVGIVNLIVLAIALLLALWQLRKGVGSSLRDKKFLGMIILLGISFIISLFLQHNKSAFIWEAIPLMAFIQFPWRFLGVTIFIIALIGAAITPYLKNKLLPLYFILIFATIISTIGYFKPKEYVDDSFFNKFLQVESMHKGIDLTKDYLPIWVFNVDGDRFDVPRADKGEIKVSNLEKSSTKQSFSVIVTTDSLIEMPITYFPNWEIEANGKVINQNVPSEMGLIRFDLPKGNYKIIVELKDTMIRTVGNIISATSILIVIGMLSFRKRYLNA